MTTYTSFWTHPDLPHAEARGRTPRLVQVRVTPHGYDDHAYLAREQSRSLLDKKFKVVEELRIPGDDGAREVVRLFLEYRQSRLAEGWTEVYAGNGLALFPGDLRAARPKTPQERSLDAAMLWLECGDFEHAQSALEDATGIQNTPYWGTVARRLWMLKSEVLSGNARVDAMAQAAVHASEVIGMLAGQDLYRIDPYHFGDTYRSPQSMLVRAAETAAAYLLESEDTCQQALQFIQLAEDTHHGSTYLQELKVAALLKLGRREEAYEVHLHCRLQLPEVLASADYTSLVDQRNRDALEQERHRLAGLRVEYMNGEPAPPADIARLQALHPGLPEACVRWLSGKERHEMRVIDGDSSESYRLLGVDGMLDKHVEMVGWLHLHDDSSPDLAEEIRESIRDSGIKPEYMLPIVGADHTPDCFLVRLEGEDLGAVYFWSHDESAVFSRIADSVDQLFPWLEAQALGGNTFVL